MRTSDHAGFGIPGVDAGEAIEQVQRYWQAWGDALRSATSGDAPASQDVWRSALDRWTQIAGAAMGAPAQRDPVDRFAQQARQWFGTMQDVASQFVGRNASAEDVVDAWRRAMGDNAENPFAAMFSQMSDRGQSGFEQWYEQVAPFLKNVLQPSFFGGANADASQFASHIAANGRDEARRWLQMPSFGLAREHQERWQALAQAQLDLQEANDAYNALMAQAGRDAFERFERKLSERAEPGRQLQSARALFDLWIDAAEEAYAEIALSPEFRTHYAALVNAQMRVRAGVQREVETIGGLFGMPTRTEVDGAHRKIAELERELRRLRKSNDVRKPGDVHKPSDSASTTSKTPLQAAARTATEKLAATVVAFAKKATASASPVTDTVGNTDVRRTKKPAPKTTAPKKAGSKKAAAKKTASRKVVSRKVVTKPAAKSSSKAAKPSRSPAHAAVKRGARPSMTMAIPDAPQPMTAAKRPASTNRKR